MSEPAVIHLTSPYAKEAIQELEDILKNKLGKTHLNKKDFVKLVNNGFEMNEEDLNKAFEELVKMCQVAVCLSHYGTSNQCLSPIQEEGIDANALQCLYEFHPSYATFGNAMNTSRELADFIKDLFDSHNYTDDGSQEEEKRGGTSANKQNHLCGRGSIRSALTRESSMSLLRDLSLRDLNRDSDSIQSLNISRDSSLTSSSVISEEDIGAASDQLLQKEDEVSLEQLGSSLLNYKLKDTTVHTRKKNIKNIMDNSLPQIIYDPSHIPAQTFVSKLAQSTFSHDALHHHFLTNLSNGFYGVGDAKIMFTLNLMVNFMDAYRSFTRTFCSHLQHTTDLVSSTNASFGDILRENLEEESGIYDEDTKEEMKNLGLDTRVLDLVPHKDLYMQCRNNLLRAATTAASSSSSDKDKSPILQQLTEEEIEYISFPLVLAFRNACDPKYGATPSTSMAAMYFGSELIVSTLYEKLSSVLLQYASSSSLNINNENGNQQQQNQASLTKQDLAFFLLHIDMDVHHANNMKKIVVAHAKDKESRVDMAYTVDDILSARVLFYERFIKVHFASQQHHWELQLPFSSSVLTMGGGGANTCSLYTSPLQNVIAEACKFHLSSPSSSAKHVLDLNCGEGHSSRQFLAMGAESVMGLDSHPNMIEYASNHPFRNKKKEMYALVNGSDSDDSIGVNENYDICNDNLWNIMETLQKRPIEFGILPGRMLEGDGCFDLVKAIFCVECMSVAQMKSICAQVSHVLVPNGLFIFTIAHHCHDMDNNRCCGCCGDCPCDTVENATSGIANIIKNVLRHLSLLHFETTTKHRNSNYVVIEAVKPKTFVDGFRMPRKINWSMSQHENLCQTLTLSMTRETAIELEEYSIKLSNNGITEDTYCPTDDDMVCLQRVSDFAVDLRRRLLYVTGAAKVSGISMERLGKGVDPEMVASRAKLAYYILSSFVGRVDGSARGRLFDVRDCNVSGKNTDNILFSVSREEAPWHTDGASADKAYEAVGLLCINPAAKGGSFRLANAAAALDELKENLPKFLLYELLRSIPRDILENGKGRGGDRGLMKLSRSNELLRRRICHNAYPIFELDSSEDRVRCRYMRHWIETGHDKAHLPVSPLLRVAMNALDATLDNKTVFEGRMEPGNMLFCNNMIFAHARDSFVNDVRCPPRHKVRVWLQLQEIERGIGELTVQKIDQGMEHKDKS